MDYRNSDMWGHPPWNEVSLTYNTLHQHFPLRRGVMHVVYVYYVPNAHNNPPLKPNLAIYPFSYIIHLSIFIVVFFFYLFLMYFIHLFIYVFILFHLFIHLFLFIYSFIFYFIFIILFFSLTHCSSVLQRYLVPLIWHLLPSYTVVIS